MATATTTGRGPTMGRAAIATTPDGTTAIGIGTTGIDMMAATATAGIATGTRATTETATVTTDTIATAIITAIATTMGNATGRLRCAALRQRAGWGGSGSLRGGAERPARRSPARVTARSP
jgi:hypothetical protein